MDTSLAMMQKNTRFIFVLLGCSAFATAATAAAPSGMLAEAFVMGLARDAEGAVWAGTEDGGVLRGDPDAGTWEAFKVPGVDGENHAYAGRDGVGGDGGGAGVESRRGQDVAVPVRAEPCGAREGCVRRME